MYTAAPKRQQPLLAAELARGESDEAAQTSSSITHGTGDRPAPGEAAEPDGAGNGAAGPDGGTGRRGDPGGRAGRRNRTAGQPGARRRSVFSVVLLIRGDGYYKFILNSLYIVTINYYRLL